MSSSLSRELEERFSAVRETLAAVMAQRVAAERRLADAEDEVLAVRQELAAIHREEGRLRFDLGELEKMRKAL